MDQDHIVQFLNVSGTHLHAQSDQTRENTHEHIAHDCPVDDADDIDQDN